MKVFKKSAYSGKTNCMEFENITPDEFDARVDRWQNGEYVQDVFSEYTPEQREFLISGVTDEEWKEVFGEED